MKLRFIPIFVLALSFLVCAMSPFSVAQPPEEQPAPAPRPQPTIEGPVSIVIPTPEGIIFVADPTPEQIEYASNFVLNNPEPTPEAYSELGRYFGSQEADVRISYETPEAETIFQPFQSSYMEALPTVEAPPTLAPAITNIFERLREGLPIYEPIPPFEYRPTVPTAPAFPTIPTPRPAVAPLIPAEEKEKVGFFVGMKANLSESLGISEIEVGYLIGSVIILAVALTLWLVSKSEIITLSGLLIGLSITTVFNFIPRWIVFLIGIVVFLMIAREFGLGK